MALEREPKAGFQGRRLTMEASPWAASSDARDPCGSFAEHARPPGAPWRPAGQPLAADQPLPVSAAALPCVVCVACGALRRRRGLLLACLPACHLEGRRHASDAT